MRGVPGVYHFHESQFVKSVFQLIIVAVFALFHGSLIGQVEEFYHPELEWNTIETEHFFVHYHDGAGRTGRVIAKIAEDIYGPVTSLYNHEPDQKVSFIVRDHDDISNGAAYFYDNKIEILAPSMDFDFRGTHNWLRNVITHEFTHIVQIQTAMKFGRTIPGLYLQWLGYESERRPDVLYGFPNIIASYPIAGTIVPAWFAEGVAQYNRRELRYDFWDSHRDMILRSYALDGNMLSWEQMGVFGKNSLGNESSYNAGFAFVYYLAQRYGEDKLNAISRALASLTEVTIDGAIERVVGKTGQQVYDEWRKELEVDYAARVADIKAQLREGKPLDVKPEAHATTWHNNANMSLFGAPPRQRINRQNLACCTASASEGFANLYPAYSPDGKRLAYVSTKDGDYFGQSALYVLDLETGEETLVQAGVRTGVSWSPDGTKLYYARGTRNNPHWSYQFDLYVYDLEKEDETRLSHDWRALSPSVSPDGTQLVFVVGKDGTTNLATSNVDGSGFQVITSYESGEQVYSPQWSPSGDRIVFDYSIKDGRDILWIRPDGTDLRTVVNGPEDSRGPVFTLDGSRILYSSDRTGIFNIYSYTIQTELTQQVTNVLGGAFMPTVNPEGDMVYAAYTSGGYKIYRFDNPGVMDEGKHHYIVAPHPSGREHGGPLAMASNGVTTPQFDWSALRDYDDTKVQDVGTRSYRNIFTSLSIVPFLRVDNYNVRNTALEVIKPGVYLFSNDVLEKIGFFAGAALNSQLERDLFMQFFYRGRLPLFYSLGLEPAASLELYNVTRKTSALLTLPDRPAFPVDVTYNLLEFDLALKQPVVTPVSTLEFRFIHSRYTANLETFVTSDGVSAPVLVPGSSELYLIANDLSLLFDLNGVGPSRTSEINPVGRKVRIRIGRELNKFNGDGEYEVTSAGLTPVYKTINFTRAEIQWREHLPLFFKDHTLTASLRAGSILGPRVDEFFDFYAGGLIGMRGYPFYAMGGNEIAVAGLAYRFPLVHNIDVRLLHLYFDKLYASVFADMGNAWTGETPPLRQFKTDAGLELRLEAFSWYAYPTRIFFGAAYGFDEFTRYVSSRNVDVTYGKEWRFYFGVLFGFDFD